MQSSPKIKENGQTGSSPKQNSPKNSEELTILIENIDSKTHPVQIIISKKESVKVLLNRYLDKVVSSYKTNNIFISSNGCSDQILPSELQYFSICHFNRGDKQIWLDLDKSVSKQLLQLSVTQHRLSFRMKLYPEKPSDLKSRLSRLLFYLQIRRNLSEGRLVCPANKPESRISVASLIYQIEDGDAPFSDISTCSIERKSIFPSTNESIDDDILQAYLKLKGMSRNEAVKDLLNLVSTFPTYEVDSLHDDNKVYISIGNLNEDIAPVRLAIYKKDTARILFDKYCDNLTSIYNIGHGSIEESKTVEEIMKSEKNYFGLRYSDQDGKLHWLELDKSVYKQLSMARPKSSSPSNNFKITFRIKHYPAKLDDLKCNLSHFLFYLQIRRDLIQGRLICPSETGINIKVGSLIYQAEEGDAPFSNISQMKAYVNEPFNEWTRKKIFLSSNDTLEEQILLAYMELKGMHKNDAVTSLLDLVTSFPTYGIDPFQVVPLFAVEHQVSELMDRGDSSGLVVDSSASVAPKSSIKRSLTMPLKTDNKKVSPSPSLVLSKTMESKTPNYYLGISHFGLQLYVGIQPNMNWTWADIASMKYSKNIFKVLHKTKNAGKPKEVKYRFRLPTSSAALSLWQWANDRMCFFTLSDAQKAKPIKSSSSLLKRSRSFKFSGRSQAEITKSVNAQVSNPQMKIGYSSMRVVNLNPTKIEGLGLSRTAKASTTSRPALIMEDSINDAVHLEKTDDKQASCASSPAPDSASLQTNQVNKQSSSFEHHSNNESTELPDGVEEVVTVEQSKPLAKAPNGVLPNGILGTHQTSNGHVPNPPEMASRSDHKGVIAVGMFALMGILVASLVYVLEARAEPGRTANVFHTWAHSIRKMPAVDNFARAIYLPARESIVSAISGSTRSSTNPRK